MSNFEWVAAAILSVVTTARITRLIVWDKYPPSVWVRTKWDQITGDSDGQEGPWTELVHCGYCAGMYVAPVVVLSGWLSGWHTAWWVVCSCFTAAYLGAITMAFDGED